MLSRANEEKSPTQATNIGIMTALTTTNASTSWIVDSSATNHMTFNPKLLHNHHEIPEMEKSKIHLPTDSVVPVKNTESSKVLTNLISNVLFIPDFKFNLLLFFKLTKELQCSVAFF